MPSFLFVASNFRVFYLFFSFYLFCPLSYGVDVTILDDDDDTLERIRWLDSWDF